MTLVCCCVKSLPSDQYVRRLSWVYVILWVGDVCCRESGMPGEPQCTFCSSLRVHATCSAHSTQYLNYVIKINTFTRTHTHTHTHTHLCSFHPVLPCAVCLWLAPSAWHILHFPVWTDWHARLWRHCDDGFHLCFLLHYQERGGSALSPSTRICCLYHIACKCERLSLSVCRVAFLTYICKQYMCSTVGTMHHRHFLTGGTSSPLLCTSAFVAKIEVSKGSTCAASFVSHPKYYS